MIFIPWPLQMALVFVGAFATGAGCFFATIALGQWLGWWS